MVEAKQTLRQFLADFHGVSVDDVAPELFDPAVLFLKEKNQSPSELGVWLLDDATREELTEYLAGRSSGELIEEGEGEADPWDEFVYYARKFFESPDFEADEREYKLEIGEKVRTAREAVQNDVDGWYQLLKKAFGPPNNLTYYITHSRFLEWAASEPAIAREAMLGLWDVELELADRLGRFVASLPSEISTPGSRLEIASFLLLAEPTKYAIYKATSIRSAMALVGAPEVSGSESETYVRALVFLDQFIEEAANRGLVLRDRLDAQSLVWTLTKGTPTSQWSPEEVESFLRYRGDRPRVWWVNQGETFQHEMSQGILRAPMTNAAGHVLQHHKNVSLVRKSDIVLHHAAGHVRAISEVTRRAEVREPNGSDDRKHWVARTKYHELAAPVDVRDMDLAKRTSDAGPFDRYGGVKQVYLVPVSVEFSDWIRNEYRDRWPEGSPWEVKQRNTWLFQSNPSLWDLREYVDETDLGDEGTFTVSRYKTEYVVGDRILLWQSGPEAGLYATGQISGDVFERASEEEHYTNAEVELAIPWILTDRVDPPILRSKILEHPVLKGLTVITSPQGTNFRVTDEQWSEIKALIDRTPAPSAGQPDRSLREIATHIADQGLVISERTLRRFHVSMRTRGFVILSGISGTGKTWLTELYADAIGAEYLLVPVAPNWTTNEDLLGYLNPLDNVYHDTVFSDFLRRAAAEYAEATAAQRVPKYYILTLDEMNLARVEYYFAKFLSAMEVRSRKGTVPIELAPNEAVLLTPNLLFVGTVNVDETTHGFSDKVFDRAQLIELDHPRDAIAEHIGSAAFRDSLLDIYDAVEESKPFAFRVIDDVKAYVGESEALEVDWKDAVDEQILQKVLTKLTGADPAIKFALDNVIDICENHGFALTHAKAKRMAEQFDRDGFTTYF